MAYDELNPPSTLFVCASPYFGAASTTTGGKCGQWVHMTIAQGATWSTDEMTGQLVYHPAPTGYNLTQLDVGTAWGWGFGTVLGLWMLGLAVSAAVKTIRLA